jgi:hypothetical protein
VAAGYCDVGCEGRGEGAGVASLRD